MALAFYTGVGSRIIPMQELKKLKIVAELLKRYDFTVRTGDALGSDEMFRSVDKSAKIYTVKDVTVESIIMAAKYHPVFNRLSPYVKCLHARSVFQVLGLNLNDPSKFLICWTPDGCESHSKRTSKTGGTGTAISIADSYCLPIINLKNYTIEECLILVKLRLLGIVPKGGI